MPLQLVQKKFFQHQSGGKGADNARQAELIGKPGEKNAKPRPKKSFTFSISVRREQTNQTWSEPDPEADGSSKKSDGLQGNRRGNSKAHRASEDQSTDHRQQDQTENTVNDRSSENNFGLGAM